MKLTEEDMAELYGERYDTTGERIFWEPDFKKWVAIKDEESNSWCIAPKKFWEANKYIPDWSITFDVPGFNEVEEHHIRADDPLSNESETLRQLGFEIIENPKWWYNK